MAAADEVVEQIEQDLRDIANADPAAVNDIRTARNHLNLHLSGSLSRMIPEVAEAVSVHSGLRLDAAIADVTGQLTDLMDIVRAVPGDEQ